MDVLSEVLKVVQLQGALFFNGEFSSPWSFCSPPSYSVAPYVAPAAGHVIIYHLLTEGRASAPGRRRDRLRFRRRLRTPLAFILPTSTPHPNAEDKTLRARSRVG